MLDKFLNSTGNDLTIESFTQWCRTQDHLASGVRRNQMRIIRNFCLYRQRIEPRCFVPDIMQFPPSHQPVRPYIFTKKEIIQILAVIEGFKPGDNSPLRRENFRLALILLYTMGLRRGELIRLTVSDYNSNDHTLLIRESKFHKSRLLPLSCDGWSEIEKLLRLRRKKRLPVSLEQPLLWNNWGDKGSYSGAAITTAFRNIFLKAGIHATNRKLPRLHDFRYTFAVHALLRWYQEGADVQTKLPLLSIYMGHISIVSTQHYLRFIDEISNSASKRFENCYGSLVSKNKRGVL